MRNSPRPSRRRVAVEYLLREYLTNLVGVLIVVAACAALYGFIYPLHWNLAEVALFYVGVVALIAAVMTWANR